jgi:hypothetical protein
VSSTQPPPIIHPVVDKNGVATIPWTLFFNQQFTGDTGVDFTPTFTNLTQTGVPTITGRYYKLGQLVYFSIRIVPATDTTATAGTTYCSFPLTAISDGACTAVSGLLGGSIGMVDAASNRIYVPGWSAVTIPLTIVGLVPGR